MTRCLDETKLQSYFDGELPIEMMESVTSHLASCVTCAAAARELEEESALVMSALAAEFETSVPTERLRERIDAAVLGQRLAVAEATQKSSGLGAFFFGLLNFGTQRSLGYASLAVVVAFAAIFAVVKLNSTPDNPSVNNTQPKGTVAVVNPPAETGTKSVTPVSTAPMENTAPPKASGNGTKGRYQQVRLAPAATPNPQ